MHQHHSDMFNGIEAGVRFTELHVVDAGGGAATKPPVTGTTNTGGSQAPVSADAAERRSQSEETKAKTAATQQAREAIKDGRISPKEKDVVKSGPVRDAVRGERERLAENVRKAEGATEHFRDSEGNLSLNRNGSPAPVGVQEAPTEHEQRVTELADKKETHGLDALDERIKQLKEAGQSGAPVEALEAQRERRAAEEDKVRLVIEDKESMVGALEAEKLELQNTENADAKDDYQALREDAQQWIDQFNENGGQFDEKGSWDPFGDNWDKQDKPVDFDTLAERFHDEPELLEQFARVQGKNDGAGGDTAAEMDSHIADVMADDPEAGTQISLRYQAAQELTGIFERYNEARDASEGGNDRIGQIDAEISILNESIAEDREALSTETLARLDEDNRRTDGILPEAATDETSTENGGTENGGTEGAGNGGQGGTDSTEENGNGQGGEAPEGADGSGGSQSTSREVAIDYAKPEHRERVLAQARERELVPAENTTFNEQGQAVYTVQPNDSYWRIADMSDGKPPHEFDAKHFQQTVSINSERLGRDPQVGLIHPNEQVIIPGRSIDELVALMGLPTTETVEVETDERTDGTGSGPQAV